MDDGGEKARTSNPLPDSRLAELVLGFVELSGFLAGGGLSDVDY